jgi:uncharacterized protein YjbI with pentapeptide repeats
LDVEAAVTVLGRLPDRFDTSRANLASVYLVEAALRGANLRGADLELADLADAFLAGANLDRIRLRGAKCNANTDWPDGFDWKAAGVILRDD